MAHIAIVGGTGVTEWEGLEITHREVVHTPYGEPSAPVTYGLLGGIEVLFLPRHGSGHTIPPHRINYRANLWGLKHLGIERIIAMAAVGGIRADMGPGAIVIPDQLVDYTWGRHHTFYEQDLTHVTHVDFTEPYCEELRQALIFGARAAGVGVVADGTYGAVQGPRLETAREIDRMEGEGCDLVGMTGMPEASLARELEICYACCAVSANWAAGRGDGPITIEEIQHNLKDGMARARRLVSEAVRLLASS
jgi:5'-methylthioinosine phosphorylase